MLLRYITDPYKNSGMSCVHVFIHVQKGHMAFFKLIKIDENWPIWPKNGDT